MSFEEFQNNTANFMKTNIVLPPRKMTSPIENDPHVQSGLFTMKFVTSEATGVILKNGKPCNIYRIEPPDAYNSGPEFKGYFCYYQPDELHLMVIDDDADIMFTPTMDGCSFGVGSETSTGARMVGHANVSRTESSAKGQASQGGTQAAQLGGAMASAEILGPSDYTPYGSGNSGTTFGVRNKGHWNFYSQVWKRVARTYQLLGVEAFT